jgi:nicotinate-nucleotide pyrophosphorylase (carboxylating)
MLLVKSYKTIVAAALKEDSAKKDITSRFTIKPDSISKATIIAKDSGVVCGIDIAKFAFFSLDKNISFKVNKKDGCSFKPGGLIATIKGKTRAILSAERVALNFLALLSGIATSTKNLVDRTSPQNVTILSTRKTTPTLRGLEKYAVRCGGGSNHRTSLSDWVLIKDNHLRASGCISSKKIDNKKINLMIKKIRKSTKRLIEVEVETLNEFLNVARAEPDIIMLDNFSLSDLKAAVKLRNSHFPSIKLEASGGITEKTIGKISSSGVDFISVGAITHSSDAIDFSLEFA